MSVKHFRAQRMLKDVQYVCQFAETHFRETETRQLWSKGMFSALCPFPLPPCAKKILFTFYKVALLFDCNQMWVATKSFLAILSTKSK